ncbi:hypothetical protein GLAREA_09829 [Glarea lozoyensis ATCC 20868]|uniref:Rhodopsin domain-containing protein n=1 Tax=Glarea lozoyensis (strain ATCC 20868 / MF5171) TaxID=1116229 RepID=S3DQF3_GLAL2|nr:uncharacterized protein GLAREA_09829 [Glarea lozoyensis ATCC 20868]EPE28708.1 hypothetical protein GLAREA_09829 [Glarea lozoyensis ATCC 20868]
MGPFDHAGRIDKLPLLITILILFTLTLTLVLTRLILLIRHHTPFHFDDYLILLATLFLIGGVSLLLTFIDEMYLFEAVLFASPLPALPSNWIAQGYDYHERAVGVMIVTWAVIVSVKMSFLAFFRRLIRSVEGMRWLWWTAAGFNGVVGGYGFSVYVASCPVFGNPRIFQCTTSVPLRAAVGYSLAQMVLDVVGDLLIIAIPIKLILAIKISPKKEIYLTLSLCLTVILIIVTIIRASGLVNKGKLDTTWEIFWQIMSAEIGIMIATATTFRALFVARDAEKGVASKAKQTPGSTSSRTLTKKKPSEKSYEEEVEAGSHLADLPPPQNAVLPPQRTVLPGVHTSIEGRSSRRGSRQGDEFGAFDVSPTHAILAEYEREDRISEENLAPNTIAVRREVWSSSETLSVPLVDEMGM